MSLAERRYTAATTRIAGVLLLLLLLLLVRGAVAVMLPTVTRGLTAISAEIVTELLLAALYALCCLLPVWAFFHWPCAFPAKPLDLTPALPRHTLGYVFFGVAVTNAAAFCNAQLVSVFRYSDFSNEVLWQSEVTANYQLILMFVSLVLVPAFFEELLFRGVILSNLLPFGKGTAIVGSAVLFGLMHQDIEQLLYAVAAGAVLGWIFVRARSIWPCVLMHFINNFHAFFQTALLSRAPGAATERILYLIQGVLMLLGLVCGVWLFLDKEESKDVQGGAKECELSLSRRVRLFFNVPMIIFVAWCVASMLFLLMMSLAMYV